MRRWTLSSLLASKPDALLAQTLLDEVAFRLERQASACQVLMQRPPRLQHNQQQQLLLQKQLDFLHYVHVDTARQCRQLLQRRDWWQSSPDEEEWTQNATKRRLVRQCLEQVRDRHAPSLERWVDVALALNETNAPEDDGDGMIITMDHIMQGRLSIQLLTHHYSLLAADEARQRRPTGIVAADHSLADLLHDAYTEAQFLCQAHYQCAPALNMDATVDQVSVTVVRPWLLHALVEICKNAMSATVVEREHSHPLPEEEDEDVERDLPPVRVSATVDDAVVSLEVSDGGTGLEPSSSSSSVSNPFAWGASSARERWDRLKEQQSYAAVRPPLASLGVGLPSSRAMLQHFGGTLDLHNNKAAQQQQGCTARLSLPTNLDIPETLPPHFDDDWSA